jgi:hypothetical protein
MGRFAPFLILAAGAVGLYFLWSKVFAPDKAGAAGSSATDDTRAYAEKVAAQAAADCAAKGGTFTRPTASESNCTLPTKPEDRAPVNYGGCPDMQSCQGFDARTGVTSPPSYQPPYQPTPPASAPTGTTGLLIFGQPTYRSSIGR